jgi:predicted enzyme related to lactoylglutathione lyase
MHKSRLSTIVIDCQTQELDGAAHFWARAFGWRAKSFPEPENAAYRELTAPQDQVKVLVQSVDHPSRVHLDIETDDVEAEVARLEALGARRSEKVRDWWVMEAPTGQRFCVVPAQRPDFESQATGWNDGPHSESAS